MLRQRIATQRQAPGKSDFDFKLYYEPKSRASKQVVESSDVIFIAVKPQYVSHVLKETKGVLSNDKIIVSIAAGIPLAVLKASTFVGSR